MKKTYLILFIFINSLISVAKSEEYRYPGKRDFYFAGSINLRPPHTYIVSKIPFSTFQGIKAGYYLKNFIGICLETGFEKHSKKVDKFIINDDVNGKYAKVGFEFYTSFLQYAFKSKPNIRVTYGFSFGIVKQKSSRTYKYAGPVYGDKIETINYDFKRMMEDFNLGIAYIKNNFRVTSKLMVGDHFTSYYRPYKIYGIAGSPNLFSFEFSIGYQLIKSKSKPFKPSMEMLYKKIFVK